MAELDNLGLIVLDGCSPMSSGDTTTALGGMLGDIVNYVLTDREIASAGFADSYQPRPNRPRRRFDLIIR